MELGLLEVFLRLVEVVLGLVALAQRDIDLAEVQTGFQQRRIEPDGLFELRDGGLLELDCRLA